jgi:hypothetical protein
MGTFQQITLTKPSMRKAYDFPFRKLQNPDNAKSTVLFDTNDVSASQGTYAVDYVGTIERPK